MPCPLIEDMEHGELVRVCVGVLLGTKCCLYFHELLTQFSKPIPANGMHRACTQVLAVQMYYDIGDACCTVLYPVCNMLMAQLHSWKYCFSFLETRSGSINAF